MLLEELFFEIGAVMVVAAGVAMLMFRLRQPLILAYIVTGILVGPSVFALTQSPEMFDVLSKIGVAFLLFTVGLGLNWRMIRDVGGIALATGVGQVVITSLLGFVIGQVLGFSPVVSAYLGVAFSFSSTIIIVKLLSDKDELDTLYGRISVGFLLVQDFIAMFILLALGAMGRGQGVTDILTQTIVKGFVLIPVCWFVSARVVPKLVGFAARSQELLFVFAIGWCFLVASVLVFFGFNMEMGALIAGVTLSGTVFEREISGRIRPLRDFFLILFFVSLGTHLGFASFRDLIVPVIIYTLYVLIGNPLIAMFIMRGLGYHPRTGFLSGTTVAQVSEFSFIVIASGITLGHLPASVMTLTTIVGLLTIAGSSSLIQHNDVLYDHLRPLFRWMEPHKSLTAERNKRLPNAEIFLLGFHKMGAALLDPVQSMNKPFLVVDYDPTVVRELSELGVPTAYGDLSDEEFLSDLKLEKSSFVISTIPESSVSLALLSYLRGRSFEGVCIVSARTLPEAAKCYEAGATYVIIPAVLGGKKMREFLEHKGGRRRQWEALGANERLVVETGIH